jgi:phosphoribosylamine---glycine ligase
VELLLASVAGRLQNLELNWRPGASICIVMASAGYPGSYTTGKVIEGLEDDPAKLLNTKVFHAGTATSNGKLVTNGGRVLGVTAWGKDLREAQTLGYEAVGRIRFEGAHWRKDIGAKGLDHK